MYYLSVVRFPVPEQGTGTEKMDPEPKKIIFRNREPEPPQWNRNRRKKILGTGTGNPNHEKNIVGTGTAKMEPEPNFEPEPEPGNNVMIFFFCWNIYITGVKTKISDFFGGESDNWNRNNGIGPVKNIFFRNQNRNRNRQNQTGTIKIKWWNRNREPKEAVPEPGTEQRCIIFLASIVLLDI